MTVRSKSEMTVASSMDASGRRAQKSAIRCKQPNAKTKRLSKVEKRRLAALAGWEKRRSKQDNKMEGATTVAKEMKLASFQSAATAASASSWERRRRKVSTTDAEDDDAGPLSRARRRKNMIASKVVKESASSSEEESDEEEEESDLEDETSKKPLSRSEAARLGWTRRRKMLAAAEAESEEESDEDEEEDEEEEETSKKPLSRSEAARLGWARRRKMLADAEAESDEEEDGEEEEEEDEEEEETSKKPLSRSEAARLGWARRRKMLAAAEAESEEESDEEEEEEEEEETSKKPLSRSEAARLGWARRRKMLAAKEAERKQVVSRSKKAPRRTKRYSAAARRNAAKRGWDRRKLTLSGNGANSDISDEAEDGAYSVQASGDNSTTDKVTTSATMKETKRIPSWLKSKPREGAKRSRRLAEDSTDSHEETARKMNELVSFLKTTRGWMEFHPSSRHGSGTATYGYIPASIASFIRGGTVSKSVVLDHGTLGVHYALDYEGYGGLKEMIDIFGIDYSPYPTEKMLEVSREVLGKRNIQVSAWDLGEDLPWQEVEQAEEKKNDLIFVANILASLNDAGNACSDKEHQDNKDQNTDLLCSQLPNISRSNSTDATSSVEDDSIQGKLVDKDVLFIQTQSVFSQWSFGIC